MRLIDADALLELYSSGIPEFDAMAVPIPVIRQNIAAMPTVDASPVVHGRWLTDNDEYHGLFIIKCSLCREEWCFEVGDDVKDLNYNFCPNCGAKMDGG